MSAPTTNPDCSRCRHFYVTWETANPRACRAYGFQCAGWPSGVVLRESGSPCNLFEVREAPEARAAPKAGSRPNERSPRDRRGR